MSTVTKPIILDETGQRIATALETLALNGGGGSSSGSGTLYQHHINIYQENPYNEICLNIVTSSNTAFTIASLLTYISNKGAEYGEDKIISCTGKITNKGAEYAVYGILSSGQLLVTGTNTEVLISDQTYSIFDTVTPVGNGGGSGGTTVVANPTLAGTEAELTGLQVGGTKYAVPQGSGGVTLYNHIIRMEYTDGSGEAIIKKTLWFNLKETTDTAYTETLFKTRLAQLSNGTILGGIMAVLATQVDNGEMETQGVVCYAKVVGGGSFENLRIFINDETNPFVPDTYNDRVVE